MKQIIFATGNTYKFQIAQKLLKGSQFRIAQRKLETPEIQSDSVEVIAAFSAQWATTVLRKPVVVSDAGCYIEALGGFPGPFIKYVNQWLSAEDLLALMKRKANRSVLWKDCLAYCEPGKDPVTFTSVFKGKIAKRVGKKLYRKTYGGIDAIFIPEGFKKTASEMSTADYLGFWSNNDMYPGWKNLIVYLKTKVK